MCVNKQKFRAASAAASERIGSFISCITEYINLSELYRILIYVNVSFIFLFFHNIFVLTMDSEDDSDRKRAMEIIFNSEILNY